MSKADDLMSEIAGRAPVDLSTAAVSCQRLIELGVEAAVWVPWVCRVAGLSRRQAKMLPDIATWIGETATMAEVLHGEGIRSFFDYKQARLFYADLLEPEGPAPGLSLSVQRTVPTSPKSRVAVVIKDDLGSILVESPPNREDDTPLEERVRQALHVSARRLQEMADRAQAAAEAMDAAKAERDLKGVTDNPDIF